MNENDQTKSDKQHHGNGPNLSRSTASANAINRATPQAGRVDNRSVSEITIRTMKDDLKAVRQGNAPVKDIPLSQAKQQTQSQKQEFTPYVRSKQKELKQVQQPTKDPERKNFTVKLLAAACLVVFVIVLGGGAVWAILNWLEGGVLMGDDNEVVAYSPAEVLPANASLVVKYAASGQNNRQVLSNIWSKQAQSGATVEGLLSGDPRILFASAEVGEFYYVLLSGESSPYLLVPNTADTRNIFAEYSDVKVSEMGNWYLVHATNTTQYLNALEQGSFQAKGGIPTSPVGDSYLMKILIGPDMLSDIYRDMEGSVMRASGGIDSVVAVINANPEEDALHFSGVALDAGEKIESMASPNLRQNIDGTLLSFVPEDAMFVHIGNNLHRDAGFWQEEHGLLDTDKLSRPEVNQFISDFTGPYAMYRRRGAGGQEDIGFVVSLPEQLQRRLTLDDRALEQTALSLLPIVTGRSALSDLTFIETEYKGATLRYVNVSDPSQAIDYLVGDTHILIASSMQGMHALIDTAIGDSGAFVDNQAWSEVLTRGEDLLRGESFTFGNFTTEGLFRLLPFGVQNTGAIFGFSTEEVNIGTYFRGIMPLDASAE